MAKSLFTPPVRRVPKHIAISWSTTAPPCRSFATYTTNNTAAAAAAHSTAPPAAPTAATRAPPFIPCIEASDLATAQQLSHLAQVDANLKRHGILKISLRFNDAQSHYLRDLVLGLHRHHDHQLPITHSATRGWFWDVRPSSITPPPSEKNSPSSSPSAPPSPGHRARSETMQCFPWHTDCSYEDQSPQYFALQVIQNDRRGGGTLSIMNVQRLVEILPDAARDALARPEYEIKIPPEFIKETERKRIVGRLLTGVVGGGVDARDGNATATAAAAAAEAAGMRFREDIVTPMTERAAVGLAELRRALPRASSAAHSTIHLSSEPDMPNGTVLLVNNRRWLHARSEVRDPDRHLRRIRWDAVEF